VEQLLYWLAVISLGLACIGCFFGVIALIIVIIEKCEQAARRYRAAEIAGTFLFWVVIALIVAVVLYSILVLGAAWLAEIGTPAPVWLTIHS
jgi:hypothetical protein